MKREDVFSPATSPMLTKIIPVLALLNHWSIWSLGVKTSSSKFPSVGLSNAESLVGKDLEQQQAWKRSVGSSGKFCQDNVTPAYFGPEYRVSTWGSRL